MRHPSIIHIYFIYFLGKFFQIDFYTPYCLLFRTPIYYTYHICNLTSAEKLIYKPESTLQVYDERRQSAEDPKVYTVRETSEPQQESGDYQILIWPLS